LSFFADHWRRASPAIDEHYGEAWRYVPMKVSGGNRPVIDAERAAMFTAGNVIVGALAEKAGVFYASSRRRLQTPEVAPEAAHTTTIDIAADALPFEPVKYDRIEQVAAPGMVFEVDSSLPDGIARIVLNVIKKRSASL
jgi:hypothetical protein